MSSVNLKENYSLRHLISFRVGGEARFFCEIETNEQFLEVKKKAIQQNKPFFILGRGTNVVISDKGFDGYIVKLSRSFSELSIEGSILKAKAATPLSRIARSSIQNNLSGMHLLAGIPGTLGGAIYMNAGAYGQEISQTVIEVKSINDQGQIITRDNAACSFSYRHSIFQENKECILEASFQLTLGSKDALEKEMNTVMQKRRDSQPLEYPNAGSVFKRTPQDFPGALVEKAGLKGFSIGGAMVSPKHANFIINTGNATAQNIYDLTSVIIETVFKQTGITLEREIIFLGDFKKRLRVNNSDKQQ